MNASPIGDKRKRGELTEQIPDLVVDPTPLTRDLPDYSNLGPMNRALAHIGNRPRLTTYIVTGLAILIGWIWIALLTAGVSSFSGTSLGPGMDGLRPLLDWIAERTGDSPALAAILRFCTPQVATASPQSLFLGTYSMWLAMSVAMMLPSAAPMLRTYADIAHVAGDRGETTVPLGVLASGYLAVWALFALIATMAQLFLIGIGTADNTTFPLGGVLGGSILLVAGLYQFTGLKDACLEKCRNPFTTLFSQWTNKPLGVFRLGVEQGAFCVGCCWALMLVMLVVGTMNLAWMAFFTLFAIVEKSGTGKVTSRVTGGILLVWGGILIALTLNVN